MASWNLSKSIKLSRLIFDSTTREGYSVKEQKYFLVLGVRNFLRSIEYREKFRIPKFPTTARRLKDVKKNNRSESGVEAQYYLSIIV